MCGGVAWSGRAYGNFGSVLLYKEGLLLRIVSSPSFPFMQPLVILLGSFAILSILRLKISVPSVGGGRLLSGRPFPFPPSDL